MPDRKDVIFNLLIVHTWASYGIEKGINYSGVYTVEDLKEIAAWTMDALELLKEPEIIRCKDCKWFIKKFVNEGRCIKHDNDFHDPDWYCADGERRTGDALDNSKC